MRLEVAKLTERARSDGLLERRHFEIVALCAGVVCLLLVLHYTAALRQLGLHDALRRLFYLPVILAAMAGGKRAGVGIAAFAVVGYLPHLQQLAGTDPRVMDSVVELVLLLVVAGLVGGYADASKRARVQAAEWGRLAALGETGLALMAQTEGPLAAIEGQAESLTASSRIGDRGSVAFAGEIIREEVARARQLLKDLGELSRVAEPRRERVDLAPLLERIVRDVATARQGRRRVIFIHHPRSCAVATDRRTVAFSLRTLMLGLLDSMPPSGWLEVRIDQHPGNEATVELGLFSLDDTMPDLEESLTRVFGAGAQEYRFRQVLCVRLLATLGASVKFERVSPCHARTLVGFVAASPGLRAETELNGGFQSLDRPVKGRSMLVGSLLPFGLITLAELALGIGRRISF